jgi:hypothetical protein
MTKIIGPKCTAEGLPRRTEKRLVRDRDGFLILEIPAAEREWVIVKITYVLALLEMEAQISSFALTERSMRHIADTVQRRHEFSQRDSGLYRFYKAPSAKTLRRWRNAYVEAGGDPIALCRVRRRSPRGNAASES